MIVECSLRSQAKSEPRKEALAGVVWVCQEFLRVSRVSRIHSVILPFILWKLESLGLGRGAFINFSRKVGCHGLPFLCIYRT